MTGPERFWPALLADRIPMRERLLAAYDDNRGYHDVRHLEEVLEHATTIMDADYPPTPGESEVDRTAVLLAAWFHDAVYEPVSGDGEERSAALAERELATAGAPGRLVDEVARLVRLTAHHRPAADDLAGQVLCDADLAILAAGTERYAEYVAGVRTEYAHVSEADFRTGRAAVLRDLLAKPRLFHTAHARTRWEAAARTNVEAEITRLESTPAG